jgi:2-(1,2-epoxy-1,2-dihydrophenyl)acetyl-CoA isomerase
MADYLIADVTDGVGSLVINRPERRNAFTAEMAQQMTEIVHRFERDDAVRAVLIRGEGETFTAGGDVHGFHDALTADRFGHASGMERRIVSGHLTFHRLRRMPKPVVVAAQGITAGMGISLMCCADFALAADDAQFTLAYRHIGLSPDGGVSYFLPRIVGERRALEITLLGERFTAAQAVAWGLVNRTFPADSLKDEAIAFARKLARGPTMAMGGAKQLIRQSLEATWDEQSAAEARTLSDVAASDDHLEGVTAFVEKRRAVFTGH